MREISSETITQAVRNMCIKANTDLPEDVASCIRCSLNEEDWEPAKEVLGEIIENFELAKETGKPICQDTGMACIFVEVGQDVHIEGNLEEAIQEGVRRGYKEGYLRKSVVSDPLERVNTGDNTPAVIHYSIVPGDQVTIDLAPKGAGSENMSRIAMLKPSDGIEGVKNFIIETVKAAGPNPCPPVIVGVGIGGTFEKAALLSKKALLRSIANDEDATEFASEILSAQCEAGITTENICTGASSSHSSFYRQLEKELLEEINKLGIGPQGFGGKTTALAVNIETFPTHIAGLPVAVNISCHVTRHIREII